MSPCRSEWERRHGDCSYVISLASRLELTSWIGICELFLYYMDGNAIVMISVDKEHPDSNIEGSAMKTIEDGNTDY